MWGCLGTHAEEFSVGIKAALRCYTISTSSLHLWNQVVVAGKRWMENAGMLENFFGSISHHKMGKSRTQNSVQNTEIEPIRWLIEPVPAHNSLPFWNMFIHKICTKTFPVLTHFWTYYTKNDKFSPLVSPSRGEGVIWDDNNNSHDHVHVPWLKMKLSNSKNI